MATCQGSKNDIHCAVSKLAAAGVNITIGTRTEIGACHVHVDKVGQLEGHKVFFEDRTGIRQSTANIQSIAAQIQALEHISHVPGVLAVDAASGSYLEVCRDLRINIMDTLGNAWIRLPGVLISVQGIRVPLAQSSRVLDIDSGTNGKIMEILRSKPEGVRQASIRSELAGVSPSLISRSLRRLEQGKFVEQKKDGSWRVL